MRHTLLCIIFVMNFVVLFSQETAREKAAIYMLNVSDSLVYYQCRVKPASFTLTTADGSFTASQQTITVTEKFVITKHDTAYGIRYYTSGYTAFPNRKFSGLKLKERDYWKFELKKEKTLNKDEVLFLATLQQTGKPTTEYDFAVTKHTVNQLIVKYRKSFDQVLPVKNISVSRALLLIAD